MSSNDLTGYPSEYEYHRRQVADLTAERDELLAEARAKFGRIEELIAERDMYYRNQKALQKSYLDALAERDKLRHELQRIGDLDYANAATNCAAYEAVCIARAALQEAKHE